MIWGLSTPSPEAQERLYEADRAAVRAAGGRVWATWDGEWGVTTCDLPGRDADGRQLKLQTACYRNPDVQAWCRDYHTVRVVQAIGRLRALRRPDEALTVEIHSSVPLANSHGLEIHELRGCASRVVRLERGLARVQTAVDALQGESIVPTFTAIRATLARLGAGGVSNSTIAKWRALHGSPAHDAGLETAVQAMIVAVEDAASELQPGEPPTAEALAVPLLRASARSRGAADALTLLGIEVGWLEADQGSLRVTPAGRSALGEALGARSTPPPTARAA